MNDNLTPDDTSTLACWISDDTDPRVVEHWKTVTAPSLFKASADDAGVILSEPRFYTLEPGEGRAGTPPDGAQGTNMRLLVAECAVRGFKPRTEESNFLLDLDPKDLAYLRKVTKRAASPHKISNEQADAIIMRYGPVTAQKLLKSAVDDRHLH